MDPDAEMPDNAREFGPRDRLVRVRRRDVLPNFARRRIAPSFDAVLASGRGRRKGAAPGPDDRIRRWGRKTIPAKPPSNRGRCGRRASGAGRPIPRHDGIRAAGRHARQWPHDRNLTKGAAPWERKRFRKSAANRRNHAVLCSRRQGNLPQCRVERGRRDAQRLYQVFP